MADYSVSVDFKANTGEFSKNVDKCKQSLNGFSQQFSGMTGKLTQGLKSFGIDTGKMFKSVSGVLSKFGLDLTQLAAKLADPIADVLGLELQIFLVVKADSVHGRSPPKKINSRIRILT